MQPNISTNEKDHNVYAEYGRCDGTEEKNFRVKYYYGFAEPISKMINGIFPD